MPSVHKLGVPSRHILWCRAFCLSMWKNASEMIAFSQAYSDRKAAYFRRKKLAASGWRKVRKHVEAFMWMPSAGCHSLLYINQYTRMAFLCLGPRWSKTFFFIFLFYTSVSMIC